MHKILIIKPSRYRSRSDPAVLKTKKRRVVPLTLPYLAALTPSDWSVQLIDEQVEEIDFSATPDLVAITVWTINSLRGYEIARRFRERGVPVIMGGPHTAFFAEEAAQYCDAVCIGEGEDVWPVMLEDAKHGRLKTIYRRDDFCDLQGLPLPRYDLLRHKPGPFQTFAVQTSRGCPFRCVFCSERFYLGERYRYRPSEDVVAEIRASRAKFVLFADSNFAGKREHSMELMEALIPLRIRWSTLIPVNLCTDTEFLDLAKASGALHLNIGFESLDSEALRSLNKRNNNVRERTNDMLSNLRKRGISYSLNFIFGTDEEDPNIFATTLDMLIRNRVPAAYFNILTPHKGTVLYETMRSQQRIIDDADIGRWPELRCYIIPKQYTPAELEERVKSIHRSFYSVRSMLRRLPFPTSLSDLASWSINLSQRKMLRSRSNTLNFDEF